MRHSFVAGRERKVQVRACVFVYVYVLVCKKHLLSCSIGIVPRSLSDDVADDMQRLCLSSDLRKALDRKSSINS